MTPQPGQRFRRNGHPVVFLRVDDELPGDYAIYQCQNGETRRCPMDQLQFDSEAIIRAFNRDQSNRDQDCLFVRRLAGQGFDRDQIADVIETLNGICKSCFDRDLGCQCWNDQ